MKGGTVKAITFFLTSLFVICLYGCATNDRQIIDAVANNVEAMPALGAHQVTVGARGGVVTLDGFVASEAKRKEVEKIASRAEGVSEVRNNLEVRQSSSTASGPKADLCSSVMDAVSAQGKGITAKCEGTLVTIRGRVASEDAAIRIGRIADDTPGVTGVINLLTTPAPVSDKVLDQRVQRAVEGLNEYNVPHYVQDRVVYFTGSVPSRQYLDPVLSAARMVEGVRDVKSTVQVGGKGNI